MIPLFPHGNGGRVVSNKVHWHTHKGTNKNDSKSVVRYHPQGGSGRARNNKIDYSEQETTYHMKNFWIPFPTRP